MLVTSIDFRLEDILDRSEMVMFDSNIIRGQRDSILEMVYDFDEQLFLDPELMERDFFLMNELTKKINSRDNVFITEGVAQESKNYVSKINCVVLYHDENFRKRRNQSKKRKNGRYENIIPIEEVEENNLCLLKRHADKYYELLRSFPNKRILSVNSQKLLSKVISRTGERDLKKDLFEKYREYHDKRSEEYKKNNITDEELSVIAYEQAKQGMNVAIVSHDKDINRIIQSCFDKESVFKYVERGSITIYFIPPGYDSYRMGFDSTLLLYNKR